ncbi:uncharacterized protein LOC121870601 [Homarus americanus]|uniref:uncharacterized protein LOC121870601 n=1 Tax=Homarus americanus TaxID=6706 RepID=UPI001C47478B|nr:uncharacterized protein LOC121870601 [Homarus americanus]
MKHNPYLLFSVIILVWHKDRRLMADENQNELTLPELHLPPGLSADTVAKVLTSVLLRQAYYQTCPWAQWLLLATLEILHGHPVPKLDSDTLHILQGTEKGLNSLDNQNFTHAVDSELKKGPDACPGNDLKSKNETVPDGKTTGIERYKSTRRKSARNTAFPHVEETIHSNWVSNKHASVEKKVLCKDVGVQVTPRIMDTTCTKCVGVEVSPGIMGITSNKLVQVKNGLQIPQSSQTKGSMDTRDTESQTEERELLKSFSRICSDKEVQTHFIRSNYSSTPPELGEHFAKMRWKLFPLSGLPERKLAGKSMYNVYANAPPVQFLKDSFVTNKDTEVAVYPEKMTDLMKFKSSSSTEECNIPVNKELNIRLFHGRPLVDSRSKKDAAGIPIERISGLVDLGLQDPRQLKDP